MANLNAIVDKLDALSVTECSDLISMLEDAWGVQAGVPQVQQMLPVEKAAPVQTEFDVYLSELGPKKIQMIKALRPALNLGLKETKELVERAPVLLKTGVTQTVVDELTQLVVDSGGKVEVK